MKIEIDGKTINEHKSVKYLRIIIDCHLNCHLNISNNFQCQKLKIFPLDILENLP